MSAATVIICVIILRLALLSIKSYLNKLQSGCCGGGDAPEKAKPSDVNPARYPYHKIVAVEGMRCQHCATRVENAFNAQEGMMARVNLRRKRADIYEKAPLDDDRIRKTISLAGYKAVRVEDISGTE